MNAGTGSFRVGVSRDFLGAQGENVWGDIGLGLLDEAGVGWEYLAEDVPVLTPELVDGYDAVLFTGPAVTELTFSDANVATPRLFARFGVGYDNIDVPACTRAGALLTITPDGARRPVATAALTLLLSASLRLTAKDALARSGRWDARTDWMGRGLTGRTIGLVGLGMSATDLVTLLRPFDVEVLAADPFLAPDVARSRGATLVPMEEMLSRSDAVIVMATYSAATHHLIDSAAIKTMKPGAILVNVSRGPIVEEPALIAALESGHLFAAGLDVFEDEPPASDNALLQLRQATLTPHCLAWTDEMSWGNGTSAVKAILDVRAGRIPKYLVNRDVLDHPRARVLTQPEAEVTA